MHQNRESQIFSGATTELYLIAFIYSAHHTQFYINHRKLREMGALFGIVISENVVVLISH
jgi:hypothetical protein